MLFTTVNVRCRSGHKNTKNILNSVLLHSTLGSKSSIAFQAIYRVIEMKGKDSKTSYTDTLLSIPFIQLPSFWNAR
jgi:hypothetical protein